MPTTLVESSTFTPSVSVPSNGDARNSASVDAPFQEVTDRTRYLYDHVNALEAAVVGVETAKTIALPLGQPIVNLNARWALDGSGYWTQVSVADAGLLVFTFNMPAIVGRITEARLALKGAGGHGAMPGTKPAFTLTKVNPETGNGSTTLIPATTDPTTLVSAYEVTHVIPKFYTTGTGPQLDGTQTLALAITGEKDANSLVGLQVYGLRLVIEP